MTTPKPTTSQVQLPIYSPLGSDRLELLERLPAARAVADRPARRRPEDVLQRRLGRAAIRAAEDGAPQLHELRRTGLAGGRWREARRAQLFAACRRDPVRRPRVVRDHFDLRLPAEL